MVPSSFKEEIEYVEIKNKIKIELRCTNNSHPGGLCEVVDGFLGNAIMEMNADITEGE